MQIKIARPDLITFTDVECPAARQVGSFVIHPEYLGLDDNGNPRFGARWTVSLPGGYALGAGAYKGPRAAANAAKAMQPSVVNPEGARLSDVFGCEAHLVFNVARRHMSLG